MLGVILAKPVFRLTVALKEVTQDKLDIEIGTFLKLAKGLSGHPLYQESLELYCSINHPIFKQK